MSSCASRAKNSHTSFFLQVCHAAADSDDVSPSSHHSEINLLEENSCTGADKGLSQHSLASNSSPRQLPQEKEQGKHTQRFPFGLSHPLSDVSLGVSSAQSLLLSL